MVWMVSLNRTGREFGGLCYVKKTQAFQET